MRYAVNLADLRTLQPSVALSQRRPLPLGGLSDSRNLGCGSGARSRPGSAVRMLRLTKGIGRHPLSAAVARQLWRASDGGSEGMAWRQLHRLKRGRGVGASRGSLLPRNGPSITGGQLRRRAEAVKAAAKLFAAPAQRVALTVEHAAAHSPASIDCLGQSLPVCPSATKMCAFDSAARGRSPSGIVELYSAAHCFPRTSPRFHFWEPPISYLLRVLVLEGRS